MNSSSFKKLPPRAIRIWQLNAVFSTLFLLLIPIAVWFIFRTVDPWILITLSVVVVVLMAARVFWFPYAIWRRWRYRITDTDIHLKRGVIISRETVIPLSRVQHVDTSQGPILRHYGLSELSVSTAATTHMIPNLDTVIAERVRSAISSQAQLAEDDV